jgi:S1-C subfamily serine protease
MHSNAAPRDDIEERVRTALARSGFYNLGVSASKSGELFIAGVVYGDSDVLDAKRIARRVAGVKRVHFLRPEFRAPDGPAYFGARTVSTPDVFGARVAHVTPGSPAALAGIVAGDIVKQFGGATVATAAELSDVLGRRAPGERVRIGLRRDGREVFVVVRLGESMRLAAN